MLSPDPKDSNYKAECNRKEKDPASFGDPAFVPFDPAKAAKGKISGTNRPTDWQPTSGLKGGGGRHDLVVVPEEPVDPVVAVNPNTIVEAPEFLSHLTKDPIVVDCVRIINVRMIEDPEMTDDSNWTEGGQIRVNVLEEVLATTITKEQRDEAEEVYAQWKRDLAAAEADDDGDA
jgi:hypothetical protein